MPTITASLLGIVISVAVPFTPLQIPNNVGIPSTYIVIPTVQIKYVTESKIINIEAIKSMQAAG